MANQTITISAITITFAIWNPIFGEKDVLVSKKTESTGRTLIRVMRIDHSRQLYQISVLKGLMISSWPNIRWMDSKDIERDFILYVPNYNKLWNDVNEEQ